MEEWTKNLLALQEIDLQCAKLTAQLSELPARAKAIQSAYAVDVQTYKVVEDAANAATAKCKALEAAGAKLAAEKLEFHKKTALIKKNDEYKIAMDRLAQFDLDIHANEDAQIAAIDEAEAARGKLAPAKAVLAEAKAKAVAVLGDLKAQDAALKASLAELQGRRPAAAAAVEPALLEKYEQLRRSRTANPQIPWVVSVANDACGRCHRHLPPQKCIDVRKGAKLTCDNCGAMLCSE